MRNHNSLLQTILLALPLIYANTTLTWYNSFAYDTSAPTSPIGSDRQEERYEAQIEMARTRDQQRREFREGQEANQVENIGLSTINAEKKSARQWEKRGPLESIRADENRITSEIKESQSSALHGSKR